MISLCFPPVVSLSTPTDPVAVTDAHQKGAGTVDPQSAFGKREEFLINLRVAVCDEKLHVNLLLLPNVETSHARQLKRTSGLNELYFIAWG